MARTLPCGRCGLPVDLQSHALCQVCRGLRLCLACARTHTCHPTCVAAGCRAGLCTKLVQAGRVAGRFGV